MSPNAGLQNFSSSASRCRISIPCPLHELLVDAAPYPQLDAVLFLERRDERPRVFRCHGGVEREAAFFLRFSEEPLRAVRALIELDLAVGRLPVLRVRLRGRERGEREAQDKS